MKVLVAGDFCPQNRVSNRFENDDFRSVLGEVQPFIEESDYAIVNFECPVCTGGEKKIPKRGPHLKCTEKGLEAVKWTGFNCITLANNHFLDYGENGVRETLELCQEYSIDTVGGGMNLQEASKILYKEINSKILAIINCCEHEFSIATKERAGSNPIDPIQQYYEIKKARKEADYVIAIVHGGHEMFQYPSPRMQDVYRFFIDAGADAVVNHHQHCFSGYEIYRGKPILYGLGNFCFDKKNIKNPIWNEGMLAELVFSNETVKLKYYPYNQCKDDASVKLLRNNDLLSFEERLRIINKVIGDNDQLHKNFTCFCEQNQRRSAVVFSPFFNRFINGLQVRGFLPKFICAKKFLHLYNNLYCESHFDKIKYFLQSEYGDERL